MEPAPTQHRRYRAVLALSSALALASTASAPSPFGCDVQMDWSAGVIEARVELDLGLAGIRLPSGRSQADSVLTAAIPSLIRDRVLAVPLDSYRTVGDSLSDGTLEPSALDGFLEGGRRLESALSRDAQKLTARYAWSLTDLAGLYVRHSRPQEPAEAGRFLATRDYSGIVVYAKGSLPVRGERRESGLRPCLLPRMFDEDMNAVLERNFVDPEALRSWGCVGYAADLDDPVVQARAGSDPLRIMASGVFGTARTDAVITGDDALRILGSPANRRLLREGRVVFVLDL